MNAGTVLIVDDSQDSRELLSGILTSEGYDVRPADSGELALAAVAVSPPEAILLDMRMPGMDGLEVCRRLKTRAETRDIPVIFLSATRDFEQRLEGLESGAVDFVSKPFHREELLARLKTHLELARLRKELETRVAERTVQLQAANEQLQRELERRRIIEDELRESEQRFRSIADTAPAILFMADSAGNLTYINQGGLTFTGWSWEQFEGQKYLELIHPDDYQRVAGAFTVAITERRSYQTEYRNKRSDGQYRWLAETGNPRFIRGEYVGHIGVAIDVTELKRSQDRAVANQKLESLGVLTAGIAHTFNNLVSTIVAHSDLALEEIPAESPAHESVSSIATVALRASEIVSLLITYTGRADSDTYEPVELSSLIERMVQLLKASIPPSTSLKVDLSTESTRIWANAGQLRQVVLNLIVNASESLDERPGTVTVSTAKVRVDQSAELPDGDYVLFEVSDTGHGMTDEVRARIFDPFYSTKSFGRGLGLPSVQGIVRDAGGAIDVLSTRGEGSRFQVWFPLWSEKSGSERQNRLGIVLLADDDDETRHAAAAALEHEGFNVMATRDGLTAVDLFQRHFKQIDAVVLDLALPGTSGAEACAEMRAFKPDIRVLFTGGGGEDEVNERVLPKPYRASDLVAALRTMMPPLG